MEVQSAHGSLVRTTELSMPRSRLTSLRPISDPLSPIQHLVLADKEERSQENRLLDSLVQKCMDQGVAIVQSIYLEKFEKHLPRPRFVSFLYGRDIYGIHCTILDRSVITARIVTGKQLNLPTKLHLFSL